MDYTSRLGELEELFGTPDVIIRTRGVPLEKARALARLQVVRAINDIRSINDQQWLNTLPYIRALLLRM
jgi:hypothetical protein